MIRAVFFDVDDTLLDYDTASRAAFHGALGEDADFELWLAMSDPHFARYGRGDVGFQQMRAERMAHYLDACGRSPSDAEELEALRFDALWSSYELFDDVLSCLATLRASGIALGVITNSEPVYQRHKLTLVGLSDAFDTVVISGDVGAAKPAAAIFAHACECLGVPAVEAVHIGDRLDLDALAAVAAGLRGVWLDRRGTATGEEDVPLVTGLAELPALVAAWRTDRAISGDRRRPVK